MNSPALTITLALLAGIIAQSVARRLQVPGIVVLLLTGVLLGPQLLNVVRPASMGAGLADLVGLSVAVILFEGGMALNLARLRNEAMVIRRLILVGSLITAAGATLSVRLTLGWAWSVCVLFGVLVIVTGPTVITPLLRRIRVTPRVSTILEAEAVLIDPIGAIVAVVALEFVIAETNGGAARGLVGLPTRLALGAAIGVVGGLIIARVLRSEKIIPEGLENVFTLAFVLALFELGDAMVPESGILAVTVAGLIVGNVSSRVTRELREFKEQLTVLLVGMLFVLLAADVRLDGVASLGWGGLATVALLMFVVRPMNVVASTWRSALSWRERAFIAWLSPRGIVAAAVASVFAGRLEDAGFEHARDLQALVFLVIAVTVLVQGLSGRWIALQLGVRRRSDQGFLIVGANGLGLTLARTLLGWGEEVVVVDSNRARLQRASQSGIPVVHGNANDEVVLEAADVDGRRGFVAVTPNEGANLLLAERARHRRLAAVYVGLDEGKVGVTEERALEAGARILFGRSVDLGSWMAAADREEIRVQLWEFTGEGEGTVSQLLSGEEHPDFIPLAVLRESAVSLMDGTIRFRSGDRIALLARSNAAAAGVLTRPGATWRQLAVEAGPQ